MPFRASRYPRTVLCVATLALAACRDRPTEPAVGSIRVAVSTTGADVDPDGYTLTLDGTETAIVGANGAVYFTSVAPGVHSVAVGGVAGNCSAAVLPVNVVAGVTVNADVSVACVTNVGDLRVVATTTGLDPDVAYVLYVGEQAPRLLLANDSLDFRTLTSGSYPVRIAGAAPNCTIAKSATRTTVVAFGATNIERVDVTCTPRVSRVLFSSTRGDTVDPFQTTNDLYTMTSTGADVVRLTTQVAALHGVWSPDGRKIAYHSVSADGRFDIHVMNADGTNDVRLTTDPLDDIYPQWSPDGTQIAFERNYQIGGIAREVWVMNADGSGQRAVIGGGHPAWSPDGTRIAFDASVLLAPNRIYTSRLDGSDVVQLPLGTFPRWSPDGRRMVFVSPPQNAAFNILVMATDGSGVVNLTRSPAGIWNEDPAWSPDGQRIAFRDNSGQIYVMKPDGTGLTNISNGNGGDSGPDWHP